MEDLRLGRFNYMVLALNDSGSGSAAMPMVMAIGVGRPFRKEFDLA
jgi:hypothetical protein